MGQTSRTPPTISVLHSCFGASPAFSTPGAPSLVYGSWWEGITQRWRCCGVFGLGQPRRGGRPSAKSEYHRPLCHPPQLAVDLQFQIAAGICLGALHGWRLNGWCHPSDPDVGYDQLGLYHFINHRSTILRLLFFSCSFLISRVRFFLMISGQKSNLAVTKS